MLNFLNCVLSTGVDFNIEAADDIEGDTTSAYLDSLAPSEVSDVAINSCGTEQSTVHSANESVVSSALVNGFTTPTSPPFVKKKRPYVRKSISKSEDPVVRLLKLSPNTIAKHTNGDMNQPPVPHEQESVDKSSVDSTNMPVPLPVSKKRTVNGPNLLRNKQVKKRVVGKSKAIYRKPDKWGETPNRTSVAGVKPLDLPEDNDLVNCVKCSAVVSVLAAREHLDVCGLSSSPSADDIGTIFSPSFI